MVVTLSTRFSIRQQAGFTELGLEGLSLEELMNTLANQMIKEELSVSEEKEARKSAERLRREELEIQKQQLAIQMEQLRKDREDSERRIMEIANTRDA